MSKKRKQDSTELNLTSENSLVSAEAEDTNEQPPIPFVHWFDKQLKAGKVKFYQDEALLVFFKKQGLKSIEDEDLYNEAFERF